MSPHNAYKHLCASKGSWLPQPFLSTDAISPFCLLQWLSFFGQRMPWLCQNVSCLKEANTYPTLEFGAIPTLQLLCLHRLRRRTLMWMQPSRWLVPSLRRSGSTTMHTLLATTGMELAISTSLPRLWKANVLLWGEDWQPNCALEMSSLK